MLVAALTAGHASAFCRMTTDGGTQVGNQICLERGEFLEWPVACLSYAIDRRGSSWMPFSDVEQVVQPPPVSLIAIVSDARLAFDEQPTTRIIRVDLLTGQKIRVALE